MSDSQAGLTADELGFLRELFAETPDHGAGAGDRRLVLDPANGDPELLAELLAASPLELRASYPGYALRYDLEIERPASGAPIALRFGVPAVVEDRLQPRYARVRPRADQVRVSESAGRIRQCRLVDISASGMRLRTERPPEAGEQTLEFELTLGYEAHRLTAEIVRVAQSGTRRDDCHLGVRFVGPDRAAREAINRYVLDHHPQI